MGQALCYAIYMHAGNILMDMQTWSQPSWSFYPSRTERKINRFIGTIVIGTGCDNDENKIKDLA